MAGPQATTTQAWQRYLIAGMATIALYFALPSGGLAQAILFVAVHLSALVATIVGIRRNRPEYAVAWWVIVAGEALYAAALPAEVAEVLGWAGWRVA